MVTDIYGMKVEIAIDTKKVYTFNNKAKVINYTAQTVKDGKIENNWIEFKEEGVVTDLETKINSYGNIAALTYALAVSYDKTKNDPENKIWDRFVQYVKENQEEFFTKTGDWKKRISVNTRNNIVELKENI